MYDREKWYLNPRGLAPWRSQVFSIVAFLLAAYGLITDSFQFGDIMIFFLGLAMLVMGLEELKNERKVIGWLLIVVFVFSLFVSIEGFLLS